MSKKIAINKEQLAFIRKVTGITDPQSALDRIIEMMVEEDLPRKHIYDLLERAMKNYPEGK